MRCVFADCRVSGEYARAFCNCAREPFQWAAIETLDVRLYWCARGYHYYAHHALVRSLYRNASRRRSGYSFSFLSSPRNSAGFSTFARLCAAARLRLCTSVCSRLCCASALPHLRLCSAHLLSTALFLWSTHVSASSASLTRRARLLHLIK